VHEKPIEQSGPEGSDRCVTFLEQLEGAERPLESRSGEAQDEGGRFLLPLIQHSRRLGKMENLILIIIYEKGWR
jgi:hypothetical protein